MEPHPNNTEEYGAPRLSFGRRVRRIFNRFGIILLILCSIGFYALGRSSVYNEHPEILAKDQSSAILAKVGALIQLPAGETPNMAVINDVAAAQKGQPFLSNAQNGDVLIVYANARSAILYRPSTNKLIAVGPVNTTPVAGTVQQAQGTPQPAASSTAADHDIQKPTAKGQ